MRLKATLLALSIGFAAGNVQAQISNETIRTYNTALNGGDREAIADAATALAAEAIANPDAPDAALLAFEAGAMLCQLDLCASARTAALMSSQAPVSDPDAHPIAADRALLLAFANWTANRTRQTRNALNSALDTVTPMAPTNLSVQAFQARYVYDMQQERTRRMIKSAGDASDHLRPVSDILPNSYATAEFIAIVSAFNHNQDPQARRDMAHLEGWLAQLRVSLGDEAPDWIEQDVYRAQAWGHTMDAWFHSTDKPGVKASELADIRDEYVLEENTEDSPEPSADEDLIEITQLRFCEGKMLQEPPLRYRSGQARRGFFGAVIIGFSIEDGLIKDADILASVPEERFEAQALETVSKWRWVPSEGEIPGANCQMNHSNVVQPLVFALD